MGEVAIPLINGYRYSWASITVSIKGVANPGVKAITYKTSIDRAETRASGRHNLGFTRGDVKHEASMEMLLSEYNDFIADLGAGYMDVVFGVTVNYSEGDLTHEDVLVGCRIADEDHARTRGTEPLDVKIKLNIQHWLHDGLPHVLGGPTQ